MLVAKQAVSADIYICDGCGKQAMVKEGELPEGWFLGEAVLVGRFKKGVWSADSERCIRKAVVAVAGNAHQERGIGSVASVTYSTKDDK